MVIDTKFLTSFLNIFKDKTNLIGLILAIFGAYLIFPSYYESTVMPLDAVDDFWLSLEPSWALAINYSNITQAVWGVDAVFSYGPLGNFCTRIGWGEGRFYFLLFDLFMAANYFVVFFDTYRKSANKLVAAGVIVVAIVILPYWIGPPNAFILLFFLVFWVRKSLGNPRMWFYIIQIAIVCLAFYIKFNTGLIVFVLYFAGISYNLITKKGATLPLFVYAISPIIIVILLSWPLNVALWPYMVSGIEMVSGYNDAMYFENAAANSLEYLGIILLLLVSIFVINLKIWNREFLYRNATIVFLFGVSIFVLYKQCFVRADAGHVLDFFVYLPLLVLCNPDFVQPLRNKWLIPVLAAAVLLPPYFLYATQNRSPDLGNRLSKSDYLRHLIDFTDEAGMVLLSQTSSALPEKVLSTIGQSTVDIFPWNIQLLFENKLNYLPRPVFQSYSAYTKYLADVNFDHYNDQSSAPEFVLYELASIDNRYPLFDEPKVNLALLKNYHIEDTIAYKKRTLLLLKKNAAFKPLVFEKISEFDRPINAPLKPRKDIYYEVEVKTTLRAKVISVFSHTPSILIEVKPENQQSLPFKTSPSLLKTGLFSDRFVPGNQNAKAFFEDSTLPAVKFYRFKPDNRALYRDQITVTEYKIRQ